MTYELQLRIETLAENWVMDASQAPSFATQGIRFSHWEFNYRDGPLHNYWLANGEIEAVNRDDALRGFGRKLRRIIPKVSLIGQCYIESEDQPFLVLRPDRHFGWLRYAPDTKGVGLMFMEDELRALNLLLEDALIPEEFYYYWNDAVNTNGYSSKLLLMFSAVEALVKIRTGKDKGKKDWVKLEDILGDDLKTDLFDTKKKPETGLRHRLVHGEYFAPNDKKDFLNVVHQKVIKYFNDLIFHENLIQENVIRPQRHLFGNREYHYTVFIRANRGKKLHLRDVLADLDNNGIQNPENHEYVYDELLKKTF
jgi:hypothetical protein